MEILWKSSILDLPLDNLTRFNLGTVTNCKNTDMAALVILAHVLKSAPQLGSWAKPWVAMQICPNSCIVFEIPCYGNSHTFVTFLMNKFWEQLLQINNILFSGWRKSRLKPASWSASESESYLHVNGTIHFSYLGEQSHKYFLICSPVLPTRFFFFLTPATQLFA